jgi:hypothetical protein
VQISTIYHRIQSAKAVRGMRSKKPLSPSVIRFYYDFHVKADKIVGAYSMRDNLEHVNLDDKLILNYISNISITELWTGFVNVREETSGGLLCL